MPAVRSNMREAKTQLAKSGAKLKAGERIVLCRGKREVAEVSPIVEPGDEL